MVPFEHILKSVIPNCSVFQDYTWLSGGCMPDSTTGQDKHPIRVITENFFLGDVLVRAVRGALGADCVR